MSQAKAQELVRDGIAAARIGDRTRTRTLLSEAVKLDPRNEMAWLWMAGVMESPLETLGCLQKVLEINPANQRALLGLKAARLQAGIAAAKAQDREIARKLLTEVIAEEPNSETAWLWLAGVTEAPEEAIIHLQRVLAINPTNERAKAGIEYYRTKATASKPVVNVGPSWQCPLCGYRAPNKQAVCPGCRAVLAVSNVDAVVSSNADKEKLRAGIQRLTAAVKLRPEYATYYYLATAHLNMGDFEASIRYFRLALAQRPDEGMKRLITILEDRWMAQAKPEGFELPTMPPSAPVTPRMPTPTPMPTPLPTARPAAPMQLNQPMMQPVNRIVAVTPAPVDKMRAGLSSEEDFLPAQPLVQPASSIRRPIPATPIPVEPPADLRKFILVVDDSPTIRKLVALTLVKNGFRIAEAGDGQEALERIQEEGIPDLVLLDITMPGMDGYELCKILRKTPETKKTPIVMLSGKDGFFNKMRGKMAGSNLYLTKPFQPDVLLKTIRQFCPVTNVPAMAG